VSSFFLLADDDRDDAELFSEALTAIDPDITFHHVENGEAVLDYLTNADGDKPDVIFLDLNMPAMSGWQCLAKLKNISNLKEIPVVMYSTSSNPREKEIALDLGAVGFVTKPTDFTILTGILEAVAKNLSGDLRKILSNNGGL
jgi:CheY-like chemotaxis protein